MIKFDIVTLFPTLFTEHFNNLPYKKAVSKNLAEYNLWDLKNYSVNNYGSVDDKTYGGGVGMVIMVEPVFKALSDIYSEKIMDDKIKGKKDFFDRNNQKIVVLSPRGERFTQKKARELSQSTQITLICGRYEGLDARIEDNIATDVISIGDFVLSGGEIPALAVMESITRILPGVLEKEEASKIESFSLENKDGYEFIEYPQYTRPENFKGLEVPKVLLSGNHKEIEMWRKEKSTIADKN